MKFCADRVHGDLLVREGHLSNRYLLVFDERESTGTLRKGQATSTGTCIICITFQVRHPPPDRCRTHPRPPHSPHRGRGRVSMGPKAEACANIHPTAGVGGSVARRSSDSKRWPARIFHPPPRTPPVTKWRNDAVPRMRSAADAPESYAPATFSRPVDAPDRGGGGRRPGAPGAGAQHRRGRSLHRGRAARRGGEDGSRGARPGRDMALWEDRSGRHTGCARRFPHDSAVATPMRRGAGRNDPPRAPESESDGAHRAPRRARGRWRSSGAPARTDPDDHPAKDSTGHAR